MIGYIEKKNIIELYFNFIDSVDTKELNSNTKIDIYKNWGDFYA